MTSLPPCSDEATSGQSTAKAGETAAPGSRPDSDRAFDCLSAAWQAHEGELLGYLRHRLADPETANDVLQDVFVKAMRHGQGFCTLDNPRAWLFQVARNTLVDRVRAAIPVEPLPEGENEPAAPEADAMPGVDALAGCLERTLAELSADDAAILAACDLGAKTLREFAHDQGLSLPAAKSRLLRARQRLRDRLTTACQVRFDPDGTVAGHTPRPADV